MLMAVTTAMTAFPPVVKPYLPLIITHISAGGIGILTGYAAVSVRKGERLHRAFGTVFVGAMLIMATMATYLAFTFQHVLPGQKGNIAAGIFALYLVTTGWLAARRKTGIGFFEKVAAVAIVGVAAMFLLWGIQATNAGGKLDGYASVFYYVFAGIAASFALMDIRVVLKGGLSGKARIARHLWRMCFAFFFAAGSFFLGQQKVMPVWMHGSPVLTALAVAPLGFLVFWLIRVKYTKWWRDDAPPAEPPADSGSLREEAIHA